FMIPLYMVRCMCNWKKTWEVWPVLLVAGGSFVIFQYTFATIHTYLPNVVLYPMTDIGGGIFSLVLTAIFLKFWKPRQEWHFDKVMPSLGPEKGTGPEKGSGPLHSKGPVPFSGPLHSKGPVPFSGPSKAAELDPHAAAARAATDTGEPAATGSEPPLTIGNVSMAWAPYALMSILLLLTGLVRQEEGRRPGKVT